VSRSILRPDDRLAFANVTINGPTDRVELISLAGIESPTSTRRGS
jgi:hypothetical protein